VTAATGAVGATEVGSSDGVLLTFLRRVADCELAGNKATAAKVKPTRTTRALKVARAPMGQECIFIGIVGFHYESRNAAPMDACRGKEIGFRVKW
jgi:hypothetical protein